MSTPTAVEALRGSFIVEVACGSEHTAVVTSAGEVYCWGWGQDGRLGNGTKKTMNVPVMAVGLQGHQVVAVSCGASHTAAVTSNGNVFCWGSGEDGQLGLGSRESFRSPMMVELGGLGALRVTQVVCGGRHTLVLTSNGLVFSWGRGFHGRLGHGDDSSLDAPKVIGALSGMRIVKIGAGAQHSMALTDVGDVFSFGIGDDGQLGHNSYLSQWTPRRVEKLTGMDVDAIACGGNHSAALTRDGRIYTWGLGVYGQLGLGNKNSSPVPVLVQDLTGIVEIACGGCSTACLFEGRNAANCSSNFDRALDHEAERAAAAGADDSKDGTDFGGEGDDAPEDDESLTGPCFSARCLPDGREPPALREAVPVDAITADMDDEEDEELPTACKACYTEFTMLNRRVVCHNCYHSFCVTCASDRMQLPYAAHEHPLPVCGACHDVLGATPAVPQLTPARARKPPSPGAQLPPVPEDAPPAAPEASVPDVEPPPLPEADSPGSSPVTPLLPSDAPPPVPEAPPVDLPPPPIPADAPPPVPETEPPALPPDM